MGFTLLTESEPLVDTVPSDTGGQIVWVLILAGFVAMYLFTTRTRRRAAEHYAASRRIEEELRANDPDLRHDDADG